jgi:hypothetical protein
MCEFVLNVVDVAELDPKKKKGLEDYLERRKKELETKLSSVNKALEVIKGRAKRARRKK